MDSRTWQNKRANLKILTNHPNTSSTLRKKHAIINKLKSTTTENFSQLLAELESENFNKFHSEIINNLLSSQLIATPPLPLSLQTAHSVFQSIHRAVEVIYLFSFDLSFMNYLTSYLKKNYLDNWTLSCILLETFLLSPKAKTSPIETVILSLLKGLKTSKLPFVFYVLEGFTVDKSIFIPFIENEMKAMKETDLEIFRVIAPYLGIKNDPNVSKSYVEVIKPAPGEFNFYSEVPMPGDVKNMVFTPVMIKGIERKSHPAYILDYIGQNIYNHPEFVTKLINKKKHIGFIPKLARILSRAIKGNKTLCNLIFTTQETEKDLLLIGECYKFGLFNAQELFELMNQLIEKNQIPKLCIILDNVGRFILYKKETNIQTIKLIEEVKESGINRESKKQFNQCISMLINPKLSNFSLSDFMRWYINNKRYKEGEILEEIKKSIRFQLLLMANTGIFKNEESLSGFINVISNEKWPNPGIFFISFYMKIIPIIYEKHKVITFSYINRISILAKTYKEQMNVMLGFNGLEIKEPMKSKMMLNVMERFSHSVQSYFLKRMNREGMDGECRAMVFNFCEKHGHEYDFEEEDSFEREMETMIDDD